MAWPNGTKVEHEFLGTYIIAGPPFTNDIGRIMVPVTTEKGNETYFNPQNLKDSGKGGKSRDETNGERRQTKGNLPKVQATLF
ncbi:hypothetical protein [Desulfotomaculum sp. 1211_IL3151]|uniref:hypothetical protein n=1 Tax=Desulfotomaculum sp. 1211_IL3151 TaxID=3084055 RepID=UPI002FD98850